jgi:23S rRNA pseudouridine1911/1915/1917 synthase
VSGEATLAGTFAAAAGGERLDRALAVALGPERPELTRSRLKQLIEDGRVSLDGRTVSEPSRRVKPGQNFALALPAPRPARVAAQALPLVVVHEDDDVIVVDKPAGLVVHPAPGNPDRTLVNALVAHCGDSLRGVGGEQRPGIVHRLDKDTSGLMVAAKTDRALAGLAPQFAAHSVERVYAAVVWGVPAPAAGEIGGRIGRSSRDRKRMAVVARGGKPALTAYRVLASLAGGRFALVECRLATGRTHQIRVHLASIGHPLVGDPVYGRSAARRRALPERLRAAVDGFGRQALDAFVLGFDHPADRKRLRFRKDYSNDIHSLISFLKEI